MTDQELRKIRRAELLEMMIRQGKTVTELQDKLEQARQLQLDTEGKLEQMAAYLEWMKQKLDKKDAQIQQQVQICGMIRRQLDQKDAEPAALSAALEQERSNRQAKLQSAATLEEASDCLKRIFEDAGRAAEQYLEKVRDISSKPNGNSGEHSHES